jgi:glycosyltransferase involved in cell wall biosynthesis
VRIHGVTDNDIHPPRFGGTQRTFGLYRGLARRHDVHVLCVVEYRNRAPRAAQADGVRLVRRRAWYTAAAWRAERLGLAPLWIASAGHTGAARAYAAALPGTPQVRALDFSLTGLLDLPGDALRVYLSQNVEYDFFRAAAPRLAARGFWAERLRAFEARAVRRADLVVAVSDEDAERFASLYGVSAERIAVIPNGWDETAVRAPSREERAAARAALGFRDDDYVCLFVGSGFAHNREALAFAVDRVMPALAAQGVKLIAAGAVARDLAARRAPWLVARPDAPDLLPLLHAADCGLNPVTRGGGSNVKVPTYLGAGLAVATTPFGMRGYAPLRPLVTIVENDALAAALRSRPRGWADGGVMPAAVADYTWGALGERLGQRFADALARRGAPPAGRTVA